jgi:excisionase family DNA binding protein
MIEIIITDPEQLSRIVKDAVAEAVSNSYKFKDEVPPSKTFLNLQEAAKFLNLAPQTLYGLTSKKAIPFFKKGKKLLFAKDALVKWMLE